MSESDGSSGTGFSSTGDASSVASDNTDRRALNSLSAGLSSDEYADEHDDVKGTQEVVFATLYTFTKNKSVLESKQLCMARVILEFLQLFRVLFNSSWGWVIARDFWMFRAIEWMLFRTIVVPKGYAYYISVFYAISAVVVYFVLESVTWAVYLKGNDPRQTWLKRLLSMRQWGAVLLYGVMWPGVLDYCALLWDCHWSGLAAGEVPYHLVFTERSCLAMPHLVHMLIAGVVLLLYSFMALTMAVGWTDMNPMNRSFLSSWDQDTISKITLLKLVLVLVSTALSDFRTIQIVMVFIIVVAICYYHIVELPYYSTLVNLTWSGLWCGLFMMAAMLITMEFGAPAEPSKAFLWRVTLTWSVLYGIFIAVCEGAFVTWLRMIPLRRLSAKLHKEFHRCKEAALAEAAGAGQTLEGSSLIDAMGDLRGIYRWKNVQQVAMICKEMRVWDEEEEPPVADPVAQEFGEFVLKCGMARLPGNATLLVMYANMLTVRKDGQAARTQIQLAQKASTTSLDAYNVYVAYQYSKSVKSDGQGLDLLSHVEFQRNYSACVRAHKAALMAQRHFWNSLLRDTISFKEMQNRLDAMEMAEQRASTVYARVLEHYPNNGKLMKIYGRFLEFVHHEPSAAHKYYCAAVKEGTSDSVVTIVSAAMSQQPAASAAVGVIDDKTDGLVIINARGIIMLVNQAARRMFGYDKGDLEGKNVSILMPQPFSSKHDGFLKRYLESRTPHIINQVRPMVALHKDRSMFPINLCTVKLSGSGQESLFLGVIREADRPSSSRSNNMDSDSAELDGYSVKKQNDTNSNSETTVNFWTTTNGLIMCADRSTADSFGFRASELVGRPFSSLCTDAEAINRFLAEVKAVDNEERDGQFKVSNKIRHTYLPPVEVELSLGHAGTTDADMECRTLIIHARVVSASQAIMVVDHKARVVYASPQFADMVGYSVAALDKMELNLLLPQPYSQMHDSWFKDLTKKPGKSSCRSGAVVHLLSAKGIKLPVTLDMKTQTDPSSGNEIHTVQVKEADASASSDQQRLLLSVNHKGTILGVNTGAPKALYGFDPAELVGQPLASVIDIFGRWRRHCGEDLSLLALLAAEEAAQPAAATGSGIAHEQQSHHPHSGNVKAAVGGKHFWRVGVHLPLTSDDGILEHAEKLDLDSQEFQQNTTGADGFGVLQLLQKHNRLQPACMGVQLLLLNDEEASRRVLEDDSYADITPVMQVSLHRSDALSATVEVDQDLSIVHVDDAAGLMFGCGAKQLLGASFASLVGLAGGTSFDNLLGSKTASAAKRGAMKATPRPLSEANVRSASRIGVPRKLMACHFGDGQALQLEMQAMSYNQRGRTHCLVQLRLVEPVGGSASLPALQRLQQRNGMAAGAMLTSTMGGTGMLPMPPGGAVIDIPKLSLPPGDLGVLHSLAGQEASGAAREAPPASESERRWSADDGNSNSTASTPPARASNRVRDWVEEASQDPGLVNGSRAAPQLKYDPKNKHRISEEQEQEDGDAWPSKQQIAVCWDVGESEAGLLSAEASRQQLGTAGLVSSQPGSAAGSASDHAPHRASEADEASEGAGSLADSAGGGHEEDEYAVDERRAKRLKKLQRLVQTNKAQAASRAWQYHTWLLLGIILVVHLVCFVSLAQKLSKKHDNTQTVLTISKLLTSSQQGLLRARFLQKCTEHQNQKYWICSKAKRDSFVKKLAVNIAEIREHHQQLFLKPFTDERLANYWTYKPLPEARFIPASANGSSAIVHGNRTLWEIGNAFSAAGDDVLFSVADVGAGLINTTYWQYMINNGPNSMFEGYTWSLDTFVDYALKDLSTMSKTFILILVVEVLVVLFWCMAYEAYLLHCCNTSHMRLFSIFLALPSATVRQMAQQQLSVDDEVSKDDMDDEMEIVDAAAVADNGQAAVVDTAAGDRSKRQLSVRMNVAGTGDKEAELDAVKRGKSGSKTKSKRNDSIAAEAHRRKQSVLSQLKKAAYERLFGWMNPKFKQNGKRMVPSNVVLLRFMAPLMLWVIGVVVVFAVSVVRLHGMEGLLASLDLAAHVMYRITRTRAAATQLVFGSKQPWIMGPAKGLLAERTMDLKRDYHTLLYGGPMVLKADVSFNPVAPSALFLSAEVTEILYRTTDCLCYDQTKCQKPSDPDYTLTHSGMDAMMGKFIDTQFMMLGAPDDFINPDHMAFIFASKVVAADVYDGLAKVIELFAASTINRLDSVKQLHLYLLLITLACMVVFVWLLYRPYLRQLRRDSKAVTGLLSQLPAEVDVEGHMKTVVLGWASTSEVGGSSSQNNRLQGM